MINFASGSPETAKSADKELGGAIHTMNPHVTFFWCDEDGQDLVEYSLLLAFLALAAIAILSGVSGSVNALWTTITSSLTSVASYMGS